MLRVWKLGVTTFIWVSNFYVPVHLRSIDVFSTFENMKVGTYSPLHTWPKS